MKLRDAPASDGVKWVRDAFTAFGRQPIGFAMISVVCMLAIFVLVSIPIVGEGLLVVLAPVGSLLFMIATRRVLGGDRPVPLTFTDLAAGRPRYPELFKLGVAYLLAAMASMALIGLVDGGALGAFMEAAASKTATPETIAAKSADPALLYGVLLRLLLASLLSVPFWHAPALVFWGGQGWAKSLFFSSVAIWRNKGAFTIYGLAWAVVGLAFAIVLGLVLGLAGPTAGTFLATPLLLVFWTVVYVSLWFTFTACFVIEPNSPSQVPERQP